ncbi:MAG TPA: FAD-linked oxidase C-terminal domain-containing protein [Terriglobales bacterium]|nr:FAD-linked oxidase C-terminal domain-containing protein [Terriglobales bacterium]
MAIDNPPLISPDELRRPIENRAPDFRLAGKNVDALALEGELKRSVEGEVRFDAGAKAMYAVDGGNYRQVPIGVVIPRSLEDVQATVSLARKYGAPLLSRAGGTSLCGQCCNVAVVMDWSKYMNKILELNPYKRIARVQPGVVCDQVVNAGKKFNLTYGPDPATHTHCCFGGMLGNNSCGAHAQMNGAASNNTEALEVLLYDGTWLSLGWLSESQWEEKMRAGGREGEIYAKLMSLRRRYEDLIRKNYPPIPRRISGYNLDQLIPDKHGRINLARALVGSEGTCATTLEATVKLIDRRPGRVVVMLGYPSVYEAGDHAPDILPYDPVALEGLDHVLVGNIEKKGGPHRKYLPLLPEGKGFLMVELGEDEKDQAIEKAHRMMEELKKGANPPAMKLFTDEQDMEHIWAIRESGLGATAFVPGEPITWEGWEDSAVAPEKVGAYLRELRALYDKYEYVSALYGHFGQGCIHCRVSFDLMSAPGIQKYRAFMEEATDLVTRFGGSISGEHGDGQSKAEFLVKMFGPELVEAFREFKSIWDPDWKMNPGKVVDPWKIDQNLRLGANYSPWDPITHFKFPEDQGSFARAALRCVGVGKCRRQDGKGGEDQTMCPSYMVTREEADSTRGRAHHLWEMLHGDVITEGWKSDHVKESLDLCLACKGCKGDCPVNVDMATYKAEFLSHYWQGRLRPRYAYAFGWIDKWARLASIAPGLVNLATQLPGLSFLAKKIAGMPRQRQIPAFAAQTFVSWFREREPKNRGAQKVLLFADTFNNHFFPETLKAAVDVLEHAGLEVVVPERHVCCGRPLYDYGFLDMAQRYLLDDMKILMPYFEQGMAMVVLEPSCCSVFRDEINGLFPEMPETHKIMENTFTISEFLEKKVKDYDPPKLRREAIVQGHCHHKAIMRLDEEKKLMEKIKLQYQELNSGCCGMAGSFGYEADKYDVSIKCGERKLLPEVRKAGLSTLIVADGFSCKEQIAQETNRHGLHIAEVMQLGIQYGPSGPPGMYPEDVVVKPRQQAVKKSMLKAGVIAGGIAAAAILGGILLGRRR